MQRKLLRAVTLTILGVAMTGPLKAEPKVGDLAPAFTLKASDGRIYDLSTFKGKRAVVLAWYPKAFTGGWTRECKSLRESGEALREFDVAYFTASCDDQETNTRFAKELELDYPILSDPEKKVARAYGVVHEGRDVPERWTFYIGEDGKVLHVDKKVSVGSHGEDIVKRLKELGIKAR